MENLKVSVVLLLVCCEAAGPAVPSCNLNLCVTMETEVKLSSKSHCFLPLDGLKQNDSAAARSRIYSQAATQPTPQRRSDCEMEYNRHRDGNYNRACDFQRVPSSIPVDPSPVKRSCPSSSSSSSSSSTVSLRMKSSRASNRSNKSHAMSSVSKLKMAELLSIKRELTVIKVQIDGLLDCVDKMDRQRKDCSECPQSRPPSMSPNQGSVSSLERESPEPGEASEDETLHYQHYYPHSYPHRIKHHRSDLEDNL